MDQKRIIIFTKYLLDLMFYTGILVEASLPFTLKLAGRYYSQEIAEHYISMLILFFLSGVCGLVIVWQLRKMMTTVLDRNCFVDSNTKSLKVMGRVAFVIAALFFIKIFILPTPATFIIILTFSVAGIFSHVHSLVFSEAVRYKQENDLTI